MKEKLTQVEVALIIRNIKSGVIDMMREIVPNKDHVIKKLVRLGILIKIPQANHKFTIDRMRFNSIQNEGGQEELFHESQ